MGDALEFLVEGATDSVAQVQREPRLDCSYLRRWNSPSLYTEPGARGDTSGNVTKLARNLETGLEIKGSSFYIEEGEKVKVYTETLTSLPDGPEEQARAHYSTVTDLARVSRLVNIAATANGDVVGQQLQRNDLNQRRKQLDGRRNEEITCSTRVPMVVSPSVATAITRPERAVTS